MILSTSYLKAIQKATSSLLEPGLSLDKTLKKICSTITSIPKYNYTFVALFDEETQVFTIKSFSGLSTTLLTDLEKLVGFEALGIKITMDMKENLAIQSTLKREIFVSYDLWEISRPIMGKRISRAAGKLLNISAYISVPFISNNDLIGGILITTDQKNIDEDEIEGIQVFSNAAAIAIKQASIMESLVESEKQYRNLVDNALAGVYQSTIEGKIYFVNEALVNMMEFDSAEDLMAEKALMRYKHPEDWKKLFQELKQKGKVTNWELEIVTRTGKQKSVLISSTLSGNMLTGTVVDITEQKRQSDEIKKKSEDLSLINAICDAINRSKPLDYLFQLLRAETKKIFGGYGVSVYILSDDGKQLVLQTMNVSTARIRKIEKLIRRKIPSITIPLEKGSLYKKILESGQPHLMSDQKGIQSLIKEFIINIAAPGTKTYTALEKLIPRINKLLNIHSLMNVPLVSDGEPIGMMDISRTEPFTEDEVMRLKFIAQEVTIALRRKQAEEELTKHAKELELMAIIDQAFTAKEPLDQIIVRIRDIYTELSYAKALSFYLYDSENHRLVRQNLGLSKSIAHKIEKLTDVNLMDYAPILKEGYRCNECLKTGEAFVADTPEDIEALYGEFTEKEHQGKLIKQVMKFLKVKAVAVVPLMSTGKPLGLITMNTDHVLPDKELQRVERISSQVANMLVKVKVEEERDRLLKQTLSQLEQIEAISGTGLALHSESNLNVALEKILGIVMALVYVKVGWIVLRNKETDQFELAVQLGLDAVLTPEEFEVFTDTKECMCHRKDKAGELTGIENIVACERAKKCSSLIGKVNVHCSVPIRIGDRVEGIINLATDKWEHLSDKQLQTLHTITGEVAIAVSSAMAEEEKKQVVAMLAASEHRYKELYENAPVIYLNLDLNRKITDCSREVPETLGYKRKEIIGRKLENFYSEESIRDMEEKGWPQTLSGKDLQRQERQLIKKDGSIVETLLDANPIFDDKGHVVGSRAIFVDITERKHAEKKLVESELRFRDLFEKAPVMYYTMDLNGGLQECNEETLKKLGYQQSELLKKNISEFLSENSQADFNHVLARIKKEKNVEGVLLELRKNNGKNLPIELSATLVLDEEGNPIAIRGASIDISDRIKAQREVERLANFPRMNPMPVVEMDQKGHINYINPASKNILKLLGIKSGEIEQILPKNYKSFIIDNLKSGKTIPNTEINLGGRTFLWSSHPLRDQDLVHLYATDITELKNIEDELISAKEKAEASDRLKNIFIGTISHEVRTPLNAILGYTDILSNDLKNSLTDEEKGHFNTIIKSGNRLKQLVDDVLDVSQIEADRVMLKQEVLPGDTAVHECIKEIEISASEKNLSVKKNLTCDTCRINVDPIRFHQAVGNIMQNAVKYTHTGGISVKTWRENESFKVSVADTGVGISEEFMPFLFALFRQQEEGFSRGYEGAGLGTYISHRFIKAMGGTIDVESTVDQGTTFTISFPVVEEEVVNEVLDVKNVEIGKSKKRVFEQILVVEDNPANLQYIEFLLKKLDLLFISAKSGEDALLSLKNNSIDCMLVDISLKGGMSGVKFMKKIRENKKYENTPIIAVTAHTMKGMREKFIKEGFSEHLPKPFSLDELIDILEKPY